MSFSLPTSLATNALARVSDTLADPGLRLVIVAVIALPIVFWVILKIRDLFPGKIVGKGYDAMDRGYLLRRRGGKNYRDYLDGRN